MIKWILLFTLSIDIQTTSSFTVPTRSLNPSVFKDKRSQVWNTKDTRITSIQPFVIRTRLYAEEPEEIEIPKELRQEIYAAEAKTAAAQGREKRLIGYGLSALVFLLFGVMNVVFTSMEQTGADLNELGYGWSKSFFLLNGAVGGYIDIIGAGLLGTMVELENRTKEETAVRIYQELLRRKEEKETRTAKKKKWKEDKSRSTSKGGKKSSKKQSKRLAALAEVVVDDSVGKSDTETETETETENGTALNVDEKDDESSIITDDTNDNSIIGKLKNFYKQADTMAASQALLLNKKLEDEGIIEKITDESGLKVIGKDAAQGDKKEKE